MPFLKALCCFKEFGVDKWILRDDLVYECGDMTVEVPAGFQTDFASVPRIPIAYLMVGDSAHEAAVVHDYLYRIDSIPVVSRVIADKTFLSAMKDMHVPAWQRTVMYWAVRLAGGFSYHNKKVEDEI